MTALPVSDHEATSVSAPNPPAPVVAVPSGGRAAKVLASPNVQAPATTEPVSDHEAMIDAASTSSPPVVAALVPPSESSERSAPTSGATQAADAFLLIYSDTLDDLEGVRIAMGNRLLALIATPMVGAKGGEFGKGMGGTPEAERFAKMVDALRALEHGAELELKRAVRKHPLGPFIKRTIGIGEKQGARLLAVIGDPASRENPSQLIAYCGYHVFHPGHNSVDAQSTSAGVDPSSGAGHRQNESQVPPAGAAPDLHPGHKHRDPQRTAAGVEQSCDPGQVRFDTQRTAAGIAPSRKKGQKANWNTKAKSRAWLLAKQCSINDGVPDKNGKPRPLSPYRIDYDAAKVKYADSVHKHPCPRCGPAGKPALVGSPLSDGHKHARALRLVAKRILRDLWIEARRVRDEVVA